MRCTCLLLFSITTAGCFAPKSSALTSMPRAEPPSAEVAEVAPAARARLEAELPPGFAITQFMPTSDWEFSRHQVSGQITERSAHAWVGLRRGAECFLTETAIYQPRVPDGWASPRVGHLALTCNGPDACSQRFTAEGILPAGAVADVDYYVPGTIGLAARVACAGPS